MRYCEAMSVSSNWSGSSCGLPAWVRHPHKKFSHATHRQNCVFLWLFIVSIYSELRQLCFGALWIRKPLQPFSKKLHYQILQRNLAMLQETLFRVSPSCLQNFPAAHHCCNCRVLNVFFHSFCQLDVPVCSAPASQVEFFSGLLIIFFLFCLLQ